MKKVNTSFSRNALGWDRTNGDKGNWRSESGVSAILELLGTLKGKKTYDIACGNGLLSRRFVLHGAKEAWASDISPELVKIAKNNYDSKKIKYLVREATDFTKIPKNYFDSVVIHQGIFYIYDLDLLFKGIHKVLKPGGSVVFTALHPLFPLAREDMGATTAMGHKIEGLKTFYNYLKSYTKAIEKTWLVGKKRVLVKYYTYSRPLEAYVNSLGKNGLYISEIKEVEGRTIIDDKKIKSKIPSVIVIKAVKV